MPMSVWFEVFVQPKNLTISQYFQKRTFIKLSEPIKAVNWNGLEHCPWFSPRVLAPWPRVKLFYASTISTLNYVWLQIIHWVKTVKISKLSPSQISITKEPKLLHLKVQWRIFTCIPFLSDSIFVTGSFSFGFLKNVRSKFDNFFRKLSTFRTKHRQPN